MAWTFDADRPIYAQVVEEITRRIICGAYAPGDRLPTVRELAAEAAVNPNTMQKAMAELEAKRLVYAQRTAGRFVTEDMEEIRRCREKLAQAKVQEFLSGMESLGYTQGEVETLCRTVFERMAARAGEGADETERERM